MFSPHVKPRGIHTVKRYYVVKLIFPRGHLTLQSCPFNPGFVKEVDAKTLKTERKHTNGLRGSGTRFYCIVKECHRNEDLWDKEEDDLMQLRFLSLLGYERFLVSPKNIFCQGQGRFKNFVRIKGTRVRESGGDDGIYQRI